MTRREKWRRGLAGCAVAIALGAQGARGADADSTTLDRMRLAADRSGVLSVEGGAVVPHLAVSGAAWLGYANDPLVLHRLDGGGRVGSVVGDRVSGALAATVGVLDRAQLTIEVPVILDQEHTPGSGVAAGTGSLDAFGVGSLRFVPKVQLLEAGRHGVDLAVLAGLSVPLGSTGFIGSEPTAQPELAVSRALGAARVAASAGALLRESRPLLDAKLGSELTAQLGAAYDLRPRTRLPLETGLALATAVSAARPFERSDETSVELRGYGAFEPVRALRLLAGGGMGLQSGWGTPDWRVFAGVQFALPRRAAPAPIAAAAPPPPVTPPPPPPAPVDGDADGLADAQDRCPAEAGPAGNGGCPDRDRDQDRVVDRQDECPDVAGPEANRGCPVRAAVRLAGDRIELSETVYFDTGRAEIQARSVPLLDGIAKVILAHPEVAGIRVEGHTDARGGAALNRALSDRRARAVVQALVARGVPADRLEHAGLGPDRPVDDNATAAGRARNRRVELHVLDTKPTKSM